MQFRDNIAHSISGYKGGSGVVVFRNMSSATSGKCFEASHFAAYKCINQGAISCTETEHVIYKNFTMLDNREGFGMEISFKNKDDEVQYGNITLEINNAHVFGEIEIPDCPVMYNGDFCTLDNKYGFFPAAFSMRGR